MTTPASGNPNAAREGAVASAHSSKCSLRASGDNRRTPATLLAATMLAAKRAATFSLHGRAFPIMPCIYVTIVGTAKSHFVSMMPAAPRRRPDETPEHVMAAQSARGALRRPVHAVARKLSAAKAGCRNAELSKSGPLSGEHASRVAS